METTRRSLDSWFIRNITWGHAVILIFAVTIVLTVAAALWGVGGVYNQ